MAWTTNDLTFIGFDPDANEGDVVTVLIGTPTGVIAIMGELEMGELEMDGRAVCEGGRWFARLS